MRFESMEQFIDYIISTVGAKNIIKMMDDIEAREIDLYKKNFWSHDMKIPKHRKS